jgi:hypothetical protein
VGARLALVIGFDLDDAAAHAVDQQRGADELARDLDWIAAEIVPSQPASVRKLALGHIA